MEKGGGGCSQLVSSCAFGLTFRGNNRLSAVFNILECVPANLAHG